MNSNWKTNYVRYRSLFLNLVGQYRKREDTKVYLELFLTLTTICIFAVFALRPTLLTISTLIKEIESKKQVIEKMDSKIKDIIAAQTAYDQNRQNIDLLSIAIPSSADPEVILRQIEGVVVDSKVNLDQLSIGEMTVLSDEPQNGSRTQDDLNFVSEKINLSISTDADYSNLYSLITGLEDLRRPFNIGQTNFSLSTTRTEITGLTLSVEIEIPVLRQQK